MEFEFNNKQGFAAFGGFSQNGTHHGTGRPLDHNRRRRHQAGTDTISHTIKEEWVKAGGKGKVYSYTVSYRPATSAFLPDLPYNIAIIELEEGVRMMSNIVDCDNDDIRIGMPVEVVFNEVTPECTLPKFRPV